jgi:uncharacterized protein YheU (UPF0270 family)
MENNENNVIVVNDENIEKALNVFGLTLSENPFEAEKSTLEKGEDTTNIVEVKKEEEIVKAEEPIVKKEETNDLMKAFGESGLSIDVLLKAQDIINSFSKLDELVKAQSAEFGKKELALNKKIDHVNNQLEKANDVINDLEKAFDVYKGMEEKLEKALTVNSELETRLKVIEETPLPSKSYTKEFLKKGEDNTSNMDGKTILSMSRDRGKILNCLSARAEMELQKGHAGIFSNGTMTYEASRILPQDLIKALNQENILIVE